MHKTCFTRREMESERLGKEKEGGREKGRGRDKIIYIYREREPVSHLVLIE